MLFIYNNNNVCFSVQICKRTVYVFFITFCTNAYNYCTLAIEMNGKFFPSIIGLLVKDTFRGTDLTRRLAITSAPVG